MCRVLLVEDEPVLRRSLNSYLARKGYRVTAVASVAEAARALDNRSFDGALVDLGLPDGSGLDVMDRIGCERAVMISANPDEGLYSRRGVLHRLDKPFGLADAARAIAALRRSA